MIKTGVRSAATRTHHRQYVLFAAYGASHMNMLIPVMERLSERADIDQSILALTTARPVAEQSGFRCVGFSDLLTDNDDQAIEMGRKLAAELGHQLVTDDESVAYMGLSYAKLVAGHGTEGAAELYQVRGRQCFLPIKTVGHLLDRMQPDLVVTTNSPRAEQALVAAAGERDIPAFPIGDLFLNSECPWMSRNGFGTRVGVLAEWVQQHLIDKGRNPEDIVVVGNLALDRLGSAADIFSGKRLRANLGWQDKTVIAWDLPFERAGDTRIAPIEQKMAILKQMAAAYPRLRFFVRAHPNQKIDFGDFPTAFRESPRKQDILAVIHAADIVLTEFSMVGFEAALAGKPVVTIGASSTVPYAELGLSRQVIDLSDLEAALKQVIVDRPSPRLDLLGAPPLGQSTDLVIAQIDELLTGAVQPPNGPPC